MNKNLLRILIYVSLFFILGVGNTSSFASSPITIDGQFEDWQNIPIAVLDPKDDNIIEDFSKLKITNDDRFLYLNLSFHNGDQLLQKENSVTLYIDTDNNISTGLAINGIGAELEMEFGAFTVYYHSSSGRKLINLSDITFRRAPTVSADEFEMGISLNCSVMTLEGSQATDTVSIMFIESDSNGDKLPDNSGGIKYKIDKNNATTVNPISLAKFNESDIRIMTYNVQNHKSHSLDNEEKRKRVERVLKALQPDIIAFQHVHTNSTIDTIIARSFPGVKWHKLGIYQDDKFIFSKYPIIEKKYKFITNFSMDAVLLDTKQELGLPLLIINTHLNAYAENDNLRQSAADNFIQVMRDLRSGCGNFHVDINTPFCVVGDFNMYGSGQVLRTIRDGDIRNEIDFGVDFPPDWDGTSITDIFSRHTHTNMGYTWRNDNLPYPPGKLDYIFYSDSNIKIGNHFILNTLAMPDADLLRYSLRKHDTEIISEHLPHIADIEKIYHIEPNDSLGAKIPCRIKLNYAYPNPFNQSATIEYELPRLSNVEIVVYNSLGEKIETLVNSKYPVGKYKIKFDGSKLASGVYFYKLKTNNYIETKKMTLLK